MTSTSAALRVAVLASGMGSNFSALLSAMHSGRLAIELVGVFSDKPSAPVLARAIDVGIHCVALQPRQFANRDVFDAALFAAVDAVQPDLIVCAGYMRILGSTALQGRSSQLINIHPSLLPRHRGLHTHQQALDAGDRVHGASMHFVTAELDGGPVIAQAVVDVRLDDTADSLAARVRAREHPLLCATVELFAQRRLSLVDGRVFVDQSELRGPLQLSPHDALIGNYQT